MLSTNDESEVKAEQNEDIKPAIEEAVRLVRCERSQSQLNFPQTDNDGDDGDGIVFLHEFRSKKRKSSVASAKVTEVVDSDDDDL